MPRTLQPILARPGDPYVTFRGQVVQPENDYDEKESVGILTPKSFKAIKKRTLRELPAPVNIINGVAAVFMYTALGIGDREICKALKITMDDLKQIKTHSAYSECFEIVSQEFISANSNLITARIAAYSHDALTSVAQVAFHGKKEEVKYRASADLLDRAGHTPKEGAGRASMSRNELRIIVVDGEKQVKMELDGKDV